MNTVHSYRNAPYGAERISAAQAKPLSLWERGWGEGHFSHNIDSRVARLLIAQSNTLKRQAPLTPAPSPPLGARGDRQA
ncbi:hypothetical protein MCERH10_00542 [Caulobacteraceae bacterium]